MSFQAQVFNVMIASPGDLDSEHGLVRTLVHEWNDVHAQSRKIVLLPLGWETHSTPLQGERPQAIINEQVLRDSDLLVAIFWTRLGTDTGAAKSGTVEEINEHVAAGRPALLYFSNAPVVMGSVDLKQYEALTAFKEECRRTGIYREFSSLEDFRETFRKHLALTINRHVYFAPYATTETAGSTTNAKGPLPGSIVLSAEARQLLLEANIGNGTILAINTLGGMIVQVNNVNVVEPNSPRSKALWEDAIQDLVDLNLIRDPTGKGQVFRLTSLGYATADSLRS